MHIKEFTTYSFPTALGLIVFHGSVAILGTIPSDLSPLAKLVGVIDGACMLYGAYDAISLVLFYGHAVTLIFYVMRTYSPAGLALLRRSIRRRAAGKMASEELVHWIRFYLREHSVSVVHFISANREIVSNICFVGLITMGIYNLFMLASLYFSPLQKQDFVFSVLLVLAQTCGSVAISLVLFGISNTIHEWGPALSKIQIHLHEGRLSHEMLRSKIKIMSYFERIHTEHKFAFTIGPLANINSKYLYEVRPLARMILNNFFQQFFPVYSGFLMMVFSMINEGKLALNDNKQELV